MSYTKKHSRKEVSPKNKKKVRKVSVSDPKVKKSKKKEANMTLLHSKKHK